MALHCQEGTISTNLDGSPNCSGTWVDVPLDFPAIDQLNEAMEIFFLFDAELFVYLVFSLILAFISGWATGLILRVLSKSK